MYLLFQTNGPEHKVIDKYATISQLHEELQKMPPGSYRIEEIQDGFAMSLTMFLEKIANIEKEAPEVLELTLGKELIEEAKEILIKHSTWIADSKSILLEGKNPFKSK